MRRSITAAAMIVALALSMFASAASAQDRPPPFNQPHTHALLIGADVEFVVPQPGLPPYVINGFDRCVELGGGKPVPLQAHHDRLHFGRAGQALAEAGQFIAPLSLFGFSSCAQFEAALPFPS